MKNVFMKMATRMNWRVLVTVIGVAACVMYLNGTTAMVEGLEAGTLGLTARVEQGPYLIYDGGSLLTSSIDKNSLTQLEGDVASCTASEVSVLSGGTLVEESYMIACEDPEDALELDLRNLSANDIWLGENIRDELLDLNLSAYVGAHVVLEHQSENETKVIRSILRGNVFSEEWVLVHPQTFHNLTQGLVEDYSFILVPIENSKDISHFESEGYEAIPTTGTIEFFRTGLAQVENDLWGIVFSSALVITILVFSLLGIEVKYREEDIKIMSQIGAGSTLIMGVFLTQALFISTLGALLGVSMGVVATSFISSWSSLFGYASFVTPQMTFNSVIVPILTAIIFGLVGGIFPSYLASRTRRRGAS